MLLVLAPPNVMPVPACPLTQVRVIGHAGKKLRVSSYNMITNSLIGSYERDITKDDEEHIVVWATPTERTIILAVLEVVKDGNIYERWAQPFIFIPNASSITIPESEVVYMSKIGGVMKTVKTTTAFLDPLVLTIIRRPGYIAIYDGTNKLVEASGKSAIFEIGFRIHRDLATVLGNMIDDDRVANVVYKAPELSPWIGSFTYIKQIADQLNFTVLGTSIARVGDYYIVKARFIADLYSNFDWHRILQIVAGVLGIATGIGLIVASWGSGAPMAIPVIISSLSIIANTIVVYEALTSEIPQDIKQKAEDIIALTKQEMDAIKNDLYIYLDSLESQGKITSQEADTIKQYVEAIIKKAEDTMVKLKDLIEESYNEGYNRGVEDSKKWIITSGVGGFVGGFALGLLIGKR